MLTAVLELPIGHCVPGITRERRVKGGVWWLNLRSTGFGPSPSVLFLASSRPHAVAVVAVVVLGFR